MKLHTLLITALAVGGAQAVVTVTDMGLTAPTIGAADTGYTGATNQRFGWDIEVLAHTFAVSGAGTIDAIYFGYNAFENGDTITLNLSVNGLSVTTGILLNGDNFSGVGGDNNNGPLYWMKFDLSSENVSVNAGANSFTMTPTANTGNSWALAPRYSSENPLADAQLSLDGSPPFSGNSDMAFAVTVVPEPTVALLGGFGLLGLLRRRRS